MSEANEVNKQAGTTNAPMPPEIEFRSLGVADDPTPFRTLNEEWIRRYFALEPRDLEILGNPKEHILDKGGRVFMMYAGDEAVGCAALLPNGDGVYELSKMSVAPRLRGSGLGRKLLQHTINQARLLGAKSLFLGSNTRLGDAVHLYEAMGFRHIAPERIPKLEYVRANVFMELPLEA
jgi:N-acetylglutamate synthase-like GNAT family acetyltransferase